MSQSDPGADRRDAGTPHLFAGVDLGGTRIKAIVARGDGRIEASRSCDTRSHAGVDSVLGAMAQLVSDMEHELGERATAAGVGLPGWVDREAGVVRFLPNLPGGWRDVAVAEELRKRLERPVHLLNDVRCATLGERVFGHGTTIGSFAFLALGTGIGGGVVIDGVVRLGALGSAGELGHQIVEPWGRPCGCGGRGCLEAYASGPALSAEGVRLLLSGQAPELHALVDGDIARVDPEALGRAARRGDSSVALAIERAGEYLGLAVANVVVTLHPEAVIFGGGVARLGELLLEPVKRTLRERVQVFSPAEVRILSSALDDQAGVLGAVALAAQCGRI